MMKRYAWMTLVVACLLLMAAYACNEDSSSDDESERTACSQASDCGAEGRLKYVCSVEGECFTIDEYCYSDEECVGECVNHLCEGGKIDDGSDGDGTGSDGDTPDGDNDQGQLPCEYECCSDADCASNNYCDLNTHSCVLIIPCDEECCQNYDCWNNPEFGADYICRFNNCVLESDPCPTECCEQQDCVDLYGSGYICDEGTCRLDQISCQPGYLQCCTDDPGNPDCLDLDELLTEAILTCNDTGDGWNISMCASFNDCISYGDGSQPDCFPNGRCEQDSDCECPGKCEDTAEGKRCKIPTVGPGESCYGDPCGTGALQTGRCQEGYDCCVDTQTNEGTCETEGSCG